MLDMTRVTAMVQHKEIEFKYRADNITLEAFKTFAESKNPTNSLKVFGPDHFFSSAKRPNEFFRLRIAPAFKQLTFKRKTTDSNNYIRTEHNIDLDWNKVGIDDIKGLCSALGYDKTSSILKDVTVYFYDRYVLSYYVCYNEDMKELGRFIELEMNEDCEFESEASAWNELTELEKEAKVLNVTAQARIKKSLFEMFGKE